MKVAAYQAPLLAAGSMDALDLIRDRVKWCEAEGVPILCCPEAILGDLADSADNPTRFAISAHGGRLDAVLAPLASDTVTTIVGFTELSACRYRRGVSLTVPRFRPALRLRTAWAAASRQDSIVRRNRLQLDCAKLLPSSRVCARSTSP